ncbi:hypothetical protein D3C76_1745840 [compost metagenome]
MYIIGLRRPAVHGIFVCSTDDSFHKPPSTNVGASLLAIAVAQSTSLSNVTRSSRTSSLPQWISFKQNYACIRFNARPPPYG